jgi:hypothetical protein
MGQKHCKPSINKLVFVLDSLVNKHNTQPLGRRRPGSRRQRRAQQSTHGPAVGEIEVGSIRHNNHPNGLATSKIENRDGINNNKTTGRRGWRSKSTVVDKTINQSSFSADDEDATEGLFHGPVTGLKVLCSDTYHTANHTLKLFESREITLNTQKFKQKSFY